MATKTPRQTAPAEKEAIKSPGRPAGKKKDAATKAALLAQAVNQQDSKADVEARRTRLKNLIMLGKERGYLTYAEVNDHLPDEMLDAEQIESVISMINDMGIQVFDQAPAAEELLMSETPAPVADEDAAEEAEAALSSVDAEFGRTTDPVRMYMREMGTKDLLTREGEIEIAKRIEEGLKHMVQAISACPLTIVQILELVDKVEKDELKIDDLVDGLMDSSGEDIVVETATEEVEAAEEEEGDDEAASAAITAANLAQLRIDALERFAAIRKCHDKMKPALTRHGFASKQYQKLLDDVSAMLLGIRFTARQVDALCETVRSIVEEVRSHERAIMDMAVNKSGMPRAHFIKTFPGLEGNPEWLAQELAAKAAYAEPLAHSLATRRPDHLGLAERVLHAADVADPDAVGEARAHRLDDRLLGGEAHREEALGALGPRQLRELGRHQQPLGETRAEARMHLVHPVRLQHVDPDAVDHRRAASINDFISRTAGSRPVNTARATIAWPMFNSSICGVSTILRTF